MSSKVWFITGASRGFGRVWADAALKRGDKSQQRHARLQALPTSKKSTAQTF